MWQVTCAHARKSLATPISRVGFGSTYAEKTSGMAKRPAGGATCESSVRSKHRKTGSDPRWASDFPWMVIVDNEGEARVARGSGNGLSLDRRGPDSVKDSSQRCHLDTFMLEV